MPTINLPTSSHQIIDNDCGAEVSTVKNPAGYSITFTIKSLKIPPIIQMAVLELDNQCFFQIGNFPSNLLSKNDAFNFTRKKKFSFDVNLPLNSNGFHFQGREIISDTIKTDAEEIPAKLHITTEEICKLLPILAKAGLSGLAANLASELLYCRYGRLILKIINKELFAHKWAGTFEVQNRQEFFFYLLDKYEELDINTNSNYSWFSNYNSAQKYFKTVLGDKIRGLCGNILGKGNRKSLNEVYEESLDNFPSSTPNTPGINLHAGKKIDNFYGEVLKGIIEKRAGKTPANKEKKLFYEYRFGIVDMGSNEDVVRFMFWDEKRKEDLHLDFWLFNLVVKQPDEDMQEKLLTKVKKLMKNNPQKKDYLQEQYELLEKLNLEEYQKIQGDLKTKCNTLVQAKNRDIASIIRKLTGLSEGTFKELVRNPTKDERELQILKLNQALTKKGISLKEETDLNEEIETLQKLNLENFFNSTDIALFRSIYFLVARKTNKLNPDEETNDN